MDAFSSVDIPNASSVLDGQGRPDERCALALAALSSSLAPLFRGRLCEILLATRAPRAFERHAVLYDLGETERCLYFIRRGLVKTGGITEEGREIIYDVRRTGDVMQGVVAVLRTLARKLGRPSGSLVEINACLTQEELAQMVAASRERVSTALNNLHREGAIRYSFDGHLLVNLAALSRHSMRARAALADGTQRV
jgi:CRP-like cAMP-binding protein